MTDAHRARLDHIELDLLRVENARLRAELKEQQAHNERNAAALQQIKQQLREIRASVAATF